eukprot:6499163-Heterocapsa_arctica.AAC.1
MLELAEEQCRLLETERARARVKEGTRQRSESEANERILALAEAMRARKEAEDKAATHCEELNRLR